MEGRHWNQDELIAEFYGIGPGGDHLRDCPLCALRLEAMRERRRQSVEDAEITAAELELQRRAWRWKVEAAEAPRWRGSVVWKAAAYAALVLGAISLRPAAPPARPAAPVQDRELFEDAFERASSDLPASLAPIENLFEGDAQ